MLIVTDLLEICADACRELYPGTVSVHFRSKIQLGLYTVRVLPAKLRR